MNSSSVARMRTSPCEGNQYSHGFWMSCRGEAKKIQLYMYTSLLTCVSQWWQRTTLETEDLTIQHHLTPKIKGLCNGSPVHYVSWALFLKLQAAGINFEKLLGWTVFKNPNFNPFQSSSVLPIRDICCFCYVILTFLYSFKRLYLCFS